jgi:HlyD family secretion protein
MIRKHFVGAAFLVTAGLIISTLAAISNEPTENTDVISTPAVQRDLTVSVRAVGELDAARSTVVCSEVKGNRGQIVWIIENGKRVDKGDVLIRLDPTPFEKKVKDLRAKVDQNAARLQAREQILQWEKVQAERSRRAAEFDCRTAESELHKLEKGEGPLKLAQLEEQAQQSADEYEKLSSYVEDLKGLKGEGYVSKTEVERARKKARQAAKKHEIARRKLRSFREYVLPARVEQARAKVARAKMEREQTKKASGFKIGEAMAAVRQAREELKNTKELLAEARAELEQCVIRAPTRGMAVLCEQHRAGQKRPSRIGDNVWQNQPLVYLPDMSSMVVHTDIREKDLHKISKGDPATVEVDSYPDLELTGKVKSIGVLAESSREVSSTTKYFEVTVAIGNRDPRLRPGMTARVKVQGAETEDALCVPIHAVFEEADQSVCFVDVGTGYEKKAVDVGLQNEDWAEIEDGLAEGERVCLSRPPLNSKVRTSGQE